MSEIVIDTEAGKRPPYVRFERVPVEDVQASRSAGQYVAKDVDYAFITPPGSKDIFKIKVTQWFENLKRDAAASRLPPKWVEDYQAAYKAWQQGQELPLNGTPIKSWGVISPAQRETLIHMHCLTVEDLAAMNDEGLRRIGMGAYDLKNKANAWLKQLGDKGPLTQEMAALQAQNRVLQGQVESLNEQVKQLLASINLQTQQHPGHVQSAPASDFAISAADILGDDEPADQVATQERRGPGRPRKGA